MYDPIGKILMNWRIKNPKLGLAHLQVATDERRNDPKNELGIATDPEFIEFSKSGDVTTTDETYSSNRQKLTDIKNAQQGQ